ncbi:protein kinase [Streptomyces sp. SCUT-3]|uniref:serine/threonine-protein kinase n=1 Tax=Streptomyces sp. SCUT-3 TaxID=2684469 RepID=UPI0015FE5C8B|nr:serine/threonine-protein kinase [Streptomyces sp. SCUT-3]QMV22930.1 protein kinase [Streptomyces sp. SCUT-3]
MANDGGRTDLPTSYGLQPPRRSPEDRAEAAAAADPAGPAAGAPAAPPAPPATAPPAAARPAAARPADGRAGGTGRLVGGRYLLQEQLGAGGMGTVWKAHDRVVDRPVAVKEPRVPEHLGERERATAYRRMLREARAAARIDHPGVVTIHDVVLEDGRPWIVMELVRGRSLADVLDEGTLPPQEAARIGLAVLNALAAAHDAGVLHRDVKPANVLIGRHDRVVLTDFGIAQVEGEAPLTETGSFVGSPEFIAPERVLGQRPGPESDLWSLGVVLYAAVEGMSPFRRQTTPGTLQAVLSAEPQTSAHAGTLGLLINRMLHKNPQSRPTVIEVRAALKAVAHPEPAAPAPAAGRGSGPAADPGRPAVPRLGRGARLGVLGAAVTAALALVLVLADPFSGVPDGWTERDETKLVNAVLAVPAGYERNADKAKVTYTDPDGVFAVSLARSEGEKRSPLETANADLTWYEEGGETDYRDTMEDAEGTVDNPVFQERDAALLDVAYTSREEEDEGTRYRELALIVVNGKGVQYRLEVWMPAAKDQAAEGERIFETVKEHLAVHDL